MMETKAYMPISGHLIEQVKNWFYEGLRHLTSSKESALEDTKNAFSRMTLPAYIVAVAAVEAFTNESYLSPVSRLLLKKSSLFEFRDDWLERLEVQDKLVLVARLVLGVTLQRDREPFQDFVELVKVRNEIVHYKMCDKVPAFVRDLNQRKVGLDIKPSQGTEEWQASTEPWVEDLSSTEGIRWAHNTAVTMMQRMVEIAPQDADEYKKRGLEGGVDYDAFRHVLLLQQHRTSDLKTIDDRSRDAEWEALGLPR